MDFLKLGYEKSLTWVLRHQPLTLAVTLGTIALTVYLYIIVPKGFFPQQDVGRLSGTILADRGDFGSRPCAIGCWTWSKLCFRIPAVDNLNAYVGGSSGGGGSALNSGKMNVTLKKPLNDPQDQFG